MPVVNNEYGGSSFLFLEVTHKNRRFKFLIDTAAQTSIMWRSTVGLKNIRPNKFQLKGVGGYKVHSYGTKTINFWSHSEKFKIDAHIVDAAHEEYDGLLGIEFLRKYSAIIDVKRQRY